MQLQTRIRIACVLCLAGAGGAYAQSTTTMPTPMHPAPITAVVLYPGSATVERTAQVAAGMKQLEIKGLPANFDTQTLRAQADAGIQIGQIVVRDIRGTEAASAREAEIEARIQALQDRIAVIEVDAKSAELAKGFLERLSVSNDNQPAIDARALSGVLESIRRGGNDAFERMHKAAVAKRDLEKQVSALQNELARVKSGARDQRTVTVNLAARQPGTLRLNYQVNGAGWKPTYRAALDSTASAVELERLAMVSQKTGEDWPNVKLRLSTGQPRLSPQAPEPRPWLLTYFKPAPQPMRYEKSEAAMAAPAPAPIMSRAVKTAGAVGRAAEDNYIPPVLENQGNFSTEFEVPSQVTLPADGREIAVALNKQSVSVKQRVRVAPRMDKAAVVTAEAARPAGVWLPGTMQLFRDGGYVGATHWNPQASDKFIFPFGRDDLVRVTVERAGEQSGSGGFLGQQAQRKVADIYTLTSSHKTPVELLVLESSPVSTSEEIRVESVFHPKPTIEAWEQRRGVVGWESVIAPNQTLKFSVDYTITYPKEGSVGGLP